jgi:hypothetical protein
MNHTRLSIPAVFILVFAMLAQPAMIAQSAPLPSGGISEMIPFLGLVSSWFSRNRTYTSAEAFIKDRRDYYDQQLATLDRQLTEGTIYTGQDDSSPYAQQAAYVRLRALLGEERTLALTFAESIKKGARRDFNQAAREEITKVVMSTAVATRVLGAIDQGFGRAIGFTTNSISDLQRLRNTTQQLQLVGGLIGGTVGQDLRDTVGNVIERINSQASLTEQELNKVKQDLAAVQSQIRNYQNMGYMPTSSEVTGDLAMQLVGLGPGTPTTEAILNILGIRSGAKKQSIRERGLALLQAGQRVRCRATVSRLQAALLELEVGAGDEGNSAQDTCQEIDTLSLNTPLNGSSNEPTSTSRPAQPADQDESSALGLIGDWHGRSCDEAEGTFIYRWSVDLMQDPATDEIVGTIKFHACPGGGRVLYRVIGKPQSNPVLTLTGDKREGGGDLFASAAETIIFTFDTTTEQITPNLAP